MTAGAILSLAALLLSAPLAPAAPAGHDVGRDPNTRTIREAEEATRQPPPVPLTAATLCQRGEHFLDDAARPSLAEARRIFELTVRFYPQASCGHDGLSRALAALYTRRIEEDDALIERARDAALRATQLDPNSAAAHAAMAGALLADLRLDEAVASADAALALAPDSVPALQTSALVRLALGDLDTARRAIEKAIQLRPDLPVSHHTLGNVQLLLGQRVDAIDSYRNALRLSADYVPSILQSAAAYEEMGNYTAAGRILGDLLEQHPEESARAHLYMGYSLMKRNSPKAALGAFEKADFKTRKGLSNGTVIYLRALCYEQLGRQEEARAAFRTVIDAWPDAAGGFASPERLVFPAYEGLGRLWLKEHRPEQAQAVMEEGIASTGASLDLYLRLARLYQEYRMPERAGALLEEAVARDLGPKNAGKLLAAYVAGARLAKEAGDRSRVERLTDSLDRQAGRLEALHDYLRDLDAMRVYSLAGRGEKALAILKRGLKDGYVRIEWVGGDPDLEGLRATEGYKELAAAGGDRSHPSH